MNSAMLWDLGQQTICGVRGPETTPVRTGKCANGRILNTDDRLMGGRLSSTARM